MTQILERWQRLRRPAVSLCIGFALLCHAAQSATVQTYAGSGAAGMRDGDRRSATFMMPFGVVWDNDGRLYVTDTTAQRLRAVLPDGRVVTIAGSGRVAPRGGWVKGGFADGHGTVAKFNYPEGLTLGNGGQIYVADSRNHCIRMVTAQGDVSTFAGDPSVAGNNDGPRSSAKFWLPISVAADAAGNVYVADVGSGIRRISQEGIVSTLPLPLKEPFGIGIMPGAFPQLIITNSVGLWIVTLSGFKDPVHVVEVARFFAGPSRVDYSEQELNGPIVLRGVEGQRSIGYPYQVAMFSDGGIAYSDYRTHMVRYVHSVLQDTAVIGGQESEAAATSGGGFADGATARSRFDSPAGVAVRKDGVVAVADAGNKRIRLISQIGRAEPLSPTKTLFPKGYFGDHDYRIALVGNSFVWTDRHGPDSIGGNLELRLNDDAALAKIHKSARVLTVRMGSDMNALREYIDFLAQTHGIDLAIVQLNSFFYYASYNVSFGPENLVQQAPAWHPRLLSDLKGLKSTLESAGVPLLLVAQPLAPELSLVETPYPQLTPMWYDMIGSGQIEAALTEPFQESDVPWINLWKTFRRDEASAAHHPIFLTVDAHFTPYGDKLVAQELASVLERLKPWTK